MKDFGLVPHRPARWPPGVMFARILPANPAHWAGFADSADS